MKSSRKIATLALGLVLLMATLACALQFPFSIKVANPAPTSTFTPTAELQQCAWTWAYGEGSPEFDAAVTAELEAQEIRASVVSSTFGENNSCGNSFSVMSLDVNAEIRVDQLADHASLQSTADAFSASLQANLPVSGAPNLGNLSLSFVTEDGQTCFWSFKTNQCAE